MNGVNRTVLFLGIGLGMFSSQVWAQVPTFSVEIAAIDGIPISPPQSSVEAEPGDVLTVEVYLRDWSVNSAPLMVYQFAFNAAGYTSGSRGNIYPKDFATTTQVPVPCTSMDTDGPENLANAFIDTSRPNFVHHGLNVFQKVGTRRCGYRYGSAVQVGAPMSVPGVKKYCGSLTLVASPDAAGTFTLALDPAALRTFLRRGFVNDQPVPITPLALEPLVITVVPETDFNIVTAYPPHNAIDARQASDLNGANPRGLTSIALTFDKATANLNPSDFVITTDPPGGAPGVMNVTPMGNKVTLTFTTFIPPARWTTITHNDFTPTHTRIGYLSGDVNNSRTSNIDDVELLIEALDGNVNLQPYQTDIDGSNFTNVRDLMAEINVLNGADMLEVYNGRSLP